MANFGPLTAEIGLPVWGTPAHFNGFRILAALLHCTVVVGISSEVASLTWSGRKRAVAQCRAAHRRNQFRWQTGRSETMSRGIAGSWTDGLSKIAWCPAVKTSVHQHAQPELDALCLA